MINRQKIIQELNLHSVGHKGWFSGMQCPWCGHEDKFGINLSNNIGIVGEQVVLSMGRCVNYFLRLIVQI